MSSGACDPTVHTRSPSPLSTAQEPAPSRHGRGSSSHAGPIANRAGPVRRSTVGLVRHCWACWVVCEFACVGENADAPPDPGLPALGRARGRGRSAPSVAGVAHTRTDGGGALGIGSQRHRHQAANPRPAWCCHFGGRILSCSSRSVPGTPLPAACCTAGRDLVRIEGLTRASLRGLDHGENPVPSPRLVSSSVHGSGAANLPGLGPGPAAGSGGLDGFRWSQCGRACVSCGLSGCDPGLDGRRGWVFAGCGRQRGRRRSSCGRGAVAGC